MLPTGQAVDTIRGVPVSCVDVSRPMVILAATSVGLTGNESKAELDCAASVMRELELIRIEAGEAMGMGDVRGSVSPKLCLVSQPHHHPGAALSARYLVSPAANDTHPTIAMTAGQCLATAALVEGSVPNQIWLQEAAMCSRDETTARAAWTVPIAHPMGVAPFYVDVRGGEALRGGEGAAGRGLLSTGYVSTVEPLFEGLAFPRGGF